MPSFFYILFVVAMLNLFQHPKTVFGKPLDLGISDNIKVSASIPTTTLTIYGYTSPTSKVELSGIKTYATTQSLADGYFEFNTLIIPRPVEELCLSTKDHQGRQSASVCIPAPPNLNYNTTTGPIIIPPTISLDKSSIKPGQTIITSGATIPNSPVKIFFFQRDLKVFTFPPEVQAFLLPSLLIQSDDQGNYSFNLPTAAATSYRIYSASLFNNQDYSPKSNTLYFTLPSFLMLFWQHYAFYLLLIPLFVISLFIFIWLTIKYYHTYRYLPAIYQKTIILR